MYFSQITLVILITLAVETILLDLHTKTRLSATSLHLHTSVANVVLIVDWLLLFVYVLITILAHWLIGILVSLVILIHWLSNTLC